MALGIMLKMEEFSPESNMTPETIFSSEWKS